MAPLSHENQRKALPFGLAVPLAVVAPFNAARFSSQENLNAIEGVQSRVTDVKAKMRARVTEWTRKLPTGSHNERRQQGTPRALPGAFRMSKAAPAAAPGAALAVRGTAGAPFAAVIPGDSAVEMVVTSSIYNFLNIYNTVLIGRLVLTWFPNPPAALVGPLSTLCDPYLNLFRGLIPPIGGTLDLSPILAFVCLNAFTSTAAALPCEMGPDGLPPRPKALGPSHAAQAWAHRMQMTAMRRMGMSPPTELSNDQDESMK